jgi:hypothetical protein
MSITANAEIREINEWLARERNRRFYDQSVSVAMALVRGKGSPETCYEFGTVMWELSVWWRNVFLRDVYEGAQTKVASTANFLQIYYLSSKILITAIDTPGAGARVFASDVQHLFFLLISFSRYEQALWLGGRTYLGDTPERFSGRKSEVWTLREVSEWESLGGDVHGWGSIVAKLRRLIPGQAAKECSAGKLPDDPMFPYWQEKPLCGYMLRLWLVMSGHIAPEMVPDGHPLCGVYEGLFQNWSDPAALESSLRDACDYHVRRSTEDGDGDYDVPEFTQRPYNVIPFEILAYRNVRKRMGLETPWPSHPLLESAFVKNLPDELPPSEDPLLLEVLAAVRKVLPEV